MLWLRLLLTLVVAVGAHSSPALTPSLDNRPGFFVGDWIGTGAEGMSCFIRLLANGDGTLLVSNASDDWLGAHIRWRNERQSIALIEVSPLPAEPHRRLLPLSELTLRSGMNQSLHLKLGEHGPVCELQLRDNLLRRSGDAGMLLEGLTEVRKSDGGR